MFALEAKKIFDAHLDLWKEWSMSNNRISWIDNNGIKHTADSIDKIESWFKSHTDQN